MILSIDIAVFHVVTVKIKQFISAFTETTYFVVCAMFATCQQASLLLQFYYLPCRF